MRHIIQRLTLLLSLMPLVLPAFAAELELMPPEEGFRGPRAPIRVQVPADWPVERLQRLAMELDGTDITRMLRREGDLVVYRPVTPLAFGEHELRVVEYLPEGDLEEIAAWTLEVRASRAFREQSSKLSGTLTVARKLALHESRSWSPMVSAEGSLKLNASASDAEWRATAAGGLIYRNPAGESARPLDLTDFLLRLERGALGLSVGHFSPLQGSLISGATKYRGVGLDYGENDRRRLRLGLFATRADSVSGFEQGLGVSDPGNRMAGGRFTFFPMIDAPQRLVLQGIVFTGESPTDGDAVFGGEHGQTGRGWSLKAGSKLLDGKLALSGEFARTRWDADGSAALARPESDSAWVVGASWKDAGSGKQPLEWALELRHGEVGPAFKSLMAPENQSDQRATSVGLAFRRGAWQWGGNWLHVRNNVDDAPDLPTSRLDQYALGISRRLEKPLGVVTSAGLTLSRSRGKPESIPAGYAEPVADDRTDALSLDFGLAFWKGTGRLKLGLSRYDDFNDLEPDTRSRSVNLSWSRRFGKLNFSPDLSWGLTEDRNGPNETESLSLRLPATLSGLRDGRLGIGVTPALNRTRDDADPSDKETRSLDAWVNWIWLKQTETRPGVDFSLLASYEVEEDKIADSDTEDWQVLGAVRVNF